MTDLTQVKMTELPDCNFCTLEQIGKRPDKIKKARYDFATAEGPWAYGCQEHFDLHHRYDTLGLGKGQELILDTDD